MILAFLAAAVADAASPAGFYRSHQMEIGAALELLPDGRFRYQLDYGAVSEGAEGRWTAKDGYVLLTSTRFEGAWHQRTFRNEPLRIDGDELQLPRYETLIRFQKQDARRE